MSIASVVGRGFGPGGSIAAIVTRGFSIGAPIVEPPNASIVTRGFGKNATIAGIVTRGFSIGAAAPQPALDFAPGGFYPELHRHSRKLRKEIERAEQYVETAPKVIAKAVDRVRNAPETPLVEPLVAQMADALAQARLIAQSIAGDLAALERKRLAELERQRAIRAAKALLDEIEAIERDDEEAIALLLAH